MSDAKQELAQFKANNGLRKNGTKGSNFYTTPARQNAPQRGSISVDGAYTTSKSRPEKLPKGAVADPILASAADLIRLLNGQPMIVKQEVFARVAALKSVPRHNTVRTMIMQELQKIA